MTEPRDTTEIDALTDAEHAVVRQAGDLWGAICAAIPDGPTRDADLRELVVHVHAIQHTFMANAAARTYPQTYRLLGSVIPPAAVPGIETSWDQAPRARVTPPGEGRA